MNHLTASQKATEKSMQRNQARQAALKALEEDPTVFQYDEHYDEMERKKAQQMDPGKKEERKVNPVKLRKSDLPLPQKK